MKKHAIAVVLVAVIWGAIGPLPAGGDVNDPWTALLARLPANKTSRDLVVLNDFDGARGALGFPEPSGSARERLRALGRLSVEAGMGTPVLFRRDPRAELGFGLTDVRRTADVGIGPTAITLLEGKFSRSKIERVAKADDVWSDELKFKEHAGTEYLSWDGEKVDRRKITDARPLGQGGRLALDSPFLWWTVGTKPIEQALEAAVGDRRSLADDEDFARLAEEMAALDAYAVLMTGEPLAADIPIRPGDDEPDEPGPGLAPYRALATGAGAEGDARFLLVVLVHDDEDTAAANAERLRTFVEQGTSAATGRPWSELLTVDETTADGNVVTARLRTERIGLWYEVVLQRDTLLTTG
jgi:hypothetical protein